MGELREVEQDTPILDAIEGRSMLVGTLLRQGKRWFQRIRERRVQKKIDARWHDVHVGKPERDEP